MQEKGVTDNEEHITPLKCDENSGARILERRPGLSCYLPMSFGYLSQNCELYVPGAQT
jgi:hypothetical protein